MDIAGLYDRREDVFEITINQDCLNFMLTIQEEFRKMRFVMRPILIVYGFVKSK
jgi:hypothetical protein